MKKYKYQMHTHTAPTSLCAVMTPEELVEALYAEGYAGCVLTNHFARGNTGVDRTLPWREFVSAYEEDYLACRRCGEKYGLDILFGIEEGAGGGREFLCYGITPQFLYDHPELAHADAALWHRTLSAHGALLVQAHPFRERGYITKPSPLPLDELDGIEVCNFGNEPEFDQKAEELARAFPHLILTSGADTHHTATVGRGGIETEERIPDVGTLVRILQGGRYTLLKE